MIKPENYDIIKSLAIELAIQYKEYIIIKSFYSNNSITIEDFYKNLQPLRIILFTLNMMNKIDDKEVNYILENSNEFEYPTIMLAKQYIGVISNER